MISPRLSQRLTVGFFSLYVLTASLLLFSFRSLPEASLWRGWRILTVSAAIGEERVTEALESNGIEGFATESNSLTRSNPGRIAPAGYLESIDARKRDWFLRDDIRYLYLKETGNLTSAVAKALEGLGTPWNLEASSTVAWLYIFLPLILWVIALKESKNRLITAAFLLPTALIPVSLNRAPGFLGALLTLLSAYFASEALPSSPLRQTRFNRARSVLDAAPALAAALCVPLTGSFSGFPDVVRLAAGFSLGPASLAAWKTAQPLLEEFLDRRREHPRFTAVKMLPVTGNALSGRSLRAGGLLLTALALGLIARGGAGMERKGLPGELPCPVPTGYTNVSGLGPDAFDAFMQRRTGGELPDLGDFLVERWNLDTLQWRRVGSPPEVPVKGSQAVYTEYGTDASGRIVGQAKTMAVFDSAFIRRALSEEASPLERMLADQGKFVSVTMTRVSR